MFKPSLPGKEPKGPATPGAPIRYTKAPLTLKRPANLEDVAFWPVTKLAALIERKLVTSTELTRDVPRSAEALSADAELLRHADRRSGAASRRPTPTARSRPASIADRCTACRGARKDLFATKGIRTTLGRRAVRRSGLRLRRDDRRAAARRRRGARRQAHARRARAGRSLVRRPHEQPVESAARARADRRPVRARRPPPAASRSRSAPKRAARSSPPRPPTASSACARRTGASAATARWRSRTRWTRSGRCAGTSRTACSC